MGRFVVRAICRCLLWASGPLRRRRRWFCSFASEIGVPPNNCRMAKFCDSVPAAGVQMPGNRAIGGVPYSRGFAFSVTQGAGAKTRRATACRVARRQCWHGVLSRDPRAVLTFQRASSASVAKCAAKFTGNLALISGGVCTPRDRGIETMPANVGAREHCIETMLAHVGGGDLRSSTVGRAGPCRYRASKLRRLCGLYG